MKKRQCGSGLGSCKIKYSGSCCARTVDLFVYRPTDPYSRTHALTLSLSPALAHLFAHLITADEIVGRALYSARTTHSNTGSIRRKSNSSCTVQHD